jgi:hypothetical protein
MNLAMCCKCDGWYARGDSNTRPPCLVDKSKFSILLIRLAFCSVLRRDFAGFLNGIVPWLFPHFPA